MPVLAQEEVRELLDYLDAPTVEDLCDRALIATMIYTFGRVGAVHESPRTTALFDRRNDEVAVDDVERILI
jgi:hypothetical protein